MCQKKNIVFCIEDLPKQEIEDLETDKIFTTNQKVHPGDPWKHFGVLNLLRLQSYREKGQWRITMKNSDFSQCLRINKKMRTKIYLRVSHTANHAVKETKVVLLLFGTVWQHHLLEHTFGPRVIKSLCKESMILKIYKNMKTLYGKA